MHTPKNTPRNDITFSIVIMVNILYFFCSSKLATKEDVYKTEAVQSAEQLNSAHGRLHPYETMYFLNKSYKTFFLLVFIIIFSIVC